MTSKGNADDATTVAMKSRFNESISAISEALHIRSKAHLEAGEFCAALESLMTARMIELRELDRAVKMADEYWGSLDRLD